MRTQASVASAMAWMYCVACADQGALSIEHVEEVKLAHFETSGSGVDGTLRGRQDGLIERRDFSVSRHPLIQGGLDFCAQA